MEASGYLAWPVVADVTMGLIVDGTHRFGAVLHRLKGQRILVQNENFFSPEVEIHSWCRVFPNLDADRFSRLIEEHGLMEVEAPPSPERALLLFDQRAYSLPPGSDIYEEYEGLHRLEKEMGLEEGDTRQTFVTEEEARKFVGRRNTLVIFPPIVEKTALIHSHRGPLPPKSTRFVFPFRVLGLKVPLDMLTDPGDLKEFTARLEEMKREPILYLGRGLVIDRVYQEEIYIYQGYTMPRDFFLREEDYRSYLKRLKEAEVLS